MSSPLANPTSESDSVAGRPPAPGVARRVGRGQVVTYGTGRLCREPGCETVLSRYNEHPKCSLHMGTR
jgi:hypothetical protein